MSINVFDKLGKILSLNEWMTKVLMFDAFLFGLSELVVGECWFRGSCFCLAAIASVVALFLETLTDCCDGPQPECYANLNSNTKNGCCSQFVEQHKPVPQPLNERGCFSNGAIALRFLTNGMWLVCLFLVWAIFRPVDCLDLAFCKKGNPEPLTTTTTTTTVAPNATAALPLTIMSLSAAQDVCLFWNGVLAAALAFTTLTTIVRILTLMPYDPKEKEKENK